MVHLLVKLRKDQERLDSVQLHKRKSTPAIYSESESERKRCCSITESTRGEHGVVQGKNLTCMLYAGVSRISGR
jgi:hypothetical protein